MRQTLTALLPLALSALTCMAAAEPGRPSAAGLVAETHVTSNALDGPVARSDVYQLLRGALSHRWGDAASETTLSLEAQATAYRRTSIEDDRSAAVSLTHRTRFGRFELRGTATALAASEGDDLIIGPLVLGTRTDKAILKLSGEAGIDLGRGFAAILTAEQAFENAGKTYFEGGIIPAARLEADAGRTSLTAALRRSAGPWAAAVTAGFGRTAYELLGDPPVSVSSTEQSIRAELRWSRGGLAFGAGLGLARLAADNGLYDRWRPVWEFAALVPLGRQVTLKAAGRAGFETVDTDDPMASFLSRAEIELSHALTETVNAGLGAYGERKENLLLENEERAYGLYAEIGLSPSPRHALLVRADWRDEFITVFDQRATTFDMVLRMAVKL